MRFGKAAAGGTAGVVLAAAAFIAPWEGMKLTAYPDRLAGNIPTVCFGETRGVALGDSYTEDECRVMLARAVTDFRGSLKRCLPSLDRLPPSVQVSFISWTYNVGAGAACRSTLVRFANAGNIEAACNQLPRWNRAGGSIIRGLSNRRGAERDLCLGAVR
jgi:lysozyme